MKKIWKIISRLFKSKTQRVPKQYIAALYQLLATLKYMVEDKEQRKLLDAIGNILIRIINSDYSEVETENSINLKIEENDKEKV